MKKIRIAVICPSEIAERRFLPSLKYNEAFEFMGVGIASPEEWFGDNLLSASAETIESTIKNQFEKADSIIRIFGGRVFNSYEAVVSASDVDAVYIPLPPALHFPWAKRALFHKKHILVEKPFTTRLSDTMHLIELANSNGLAVHENYMFQYHKQLGDIMAIINSEKLGDVRLFRVAFGFPRRSFNDFRYNKILGGGAVLDCGGYTIKYASILLGNTARVVQAYSNNLQGFNVDMFGSAVMINDSGITAQLAFGMDNSYKCELEVWGSKARLVTNRVLTAPAGVTPEARIIDSQGNEDTILLSADDSFGKSIDVFADCILSSQTRECNYKEVKRQAELLNQFMELSNE